jgi:FtsP/CotA-like multicopper oxidase with cupredoxin domain
MAKHRKTKLQEIFRENPDFKSALPGGLSRRNFMGQALAASAGLAISSAIPGLAETATQSGPGCIQCNNPPSSSNPGKNCGLELHNPPEIVRGGDGMLHGVLVAQSEERTVYTYDTIAQQYNCQSVKLRAYVGYKGKTLNPANRVNPPGVLGPGPTFRAQVGDTVKIAFLNHISLKDFPETKEGTCDIVTDSSGTQIYPGIKPKPPFPDQTPDCFRGSNTTNVHFHGTHVTPSCWGDNVLVEVLPYAASLPEWCDPIFNICKDASCPEDWKHRDPARFLKYQNWKTLAYSRLAAVEKQFEAGHFAKPLVVSNKELESYNEWPQYWPGYYPYCLNLPKWTPDGPYEMGQAPGTHWYHAHKHGSTSIQVFNGMAGALIIEGDYDKKLHQTMPGVQEKVMVWQQIQVQPNRERTGGAGGATKAPSSAAAINVNGQIQPVITMFPGEVQWWRIVNGTVQANNPAFNYSFVGVGGGVAPAFRQIAQDGVQYHWDNYKAQITQPKTSILSAPGNRVDILVQAPTTTGYVALVQGPPNTTPAPGNIVLYINVQSGSGPYNQKWPESKDEFPEMPQYLADIETVTEGRFLHYQMGGAGTPPMINNKQFSEGTVDESMLLGTAQEWTITNNSSNAAHPFHIHVNPFQIVEVFDPTTMSTPLKLPQPWIWWDTIALPLAKKSGSTITPGYIKMRTRFADFTGKYVDHCHILAHEDRGMMQLIQVVDKKTVVKHH